MRRPIRQTSRTNNGAGSSGSVTLEAALVMPVFLLLAFFLMFLVQTSVMAMALHGALSQTVRVAASAWYPIYLLQDDSNSAQAQGSEKKGGVRETIGEFGTWLPAPLDEWASAIADGEWSPETEAAKAAFRHAALSFADSRVLKEDRFRVIAVGLPKAGDRTDAFLTIEAEYRLPFRVPFTGKPLAIRATAKERAWIGGLPSRATEDNPDGGKLNVAFVSLEPNPVRPGRKATLVLRAEPGTSLDLSIMYKSGQSQAKHLGSAVVGESGLVSWTWHVSGNTTPGTWNWIVRGEGGASYGQPFDVERINK